jgi:hypothetical protein
MRTQAMEKGPSQEDVRAAEAMLLGDRAAMIHDMVDRLAGRLEQTPATPTAGST